MDYIAEANKYMYDDNYIVENRFELNGKIWPAKKYAEASLIKQGLSGAKLADALSHGKLLGARHVSKKKPEADWRTFNSDDRLIGKTLTHDGEKYKVTTLIGDSRIGAIKMTGKDKGERKDFGRVEARELVDSHKKDKAIEREREWQKWQKSLTKVNESEIKINGKDFPTIEQGKAYLKKLGLKNDEIEKKIELGRHLAHSHAIIDKHQSLGDKTDKHEKTVKYDAFEHGDIHNDIAAGLRKKKDVSDEDIKKLKDHNEKAKKVIDLTSKEPEKKENPKIAEIKKHIADLTKQLNACDEDDDHRILQLDDAIGEYRKELKELEAKKS